MKRLAIYGMMAEFDTTSDLVAAARRTHEAGYRKIDAYSPFPVEGLRWDFTRMPCHWLC